MTTFSTPGDEPGPREATLDPRSWEEFRSLAHRMVDDMIDHLASLRDRPAWQPMPEEIRASFHEPLPRQGIGAEAAYAAFLERVLPSRWTCTSEAPFPSGSHARWCATLMRTGTPFPWPRATWRRPRAASPPEGCRTPSGALS